jgi:uncharacterized protein (TIGR02466 family)
MQILPLMEVAWLRRCGCGGQTRAKLLTLRLARSSASRMSEIERLFVTKVYEAMVRGRGSRLLNDELRVAIHAVAEDDIAGQRWSVENGYKGYTSYASLNDLVWRMPEFAALKEHLDGHVATFVEELDYDLQGQRLELDSIWINVLEHGGVHGAHIHPHSVISGTYYVDVPPGAASIRFEDPRLAMMMAAPVRRTDARAENRTFVAVAPKPGMVLLWESFLRHDVPMNQADTARISVSFNYGLADADDDN